LTSGCTHLRCNNLSDFALPGVLNVGFVEELYAQYSRDPNSVPEEWRGYFRQLDEGSGDGSIRASSPPRLVSSSINRHQRDEVRGFGAQDRVDQLIRVYRMRGHIIAQIDPLGRTRPSLPELDPSFYGLSDADMDRRFSAETLYSEGPLTLREILRRLRNTYCRFIGVEYMHIDDLQVRRWLRKRMETTENRIQLSRDEQIRILTRLTDAVTFEEFIRKKYVGAKSFSLEGSESLIPLLDLAIEKGAEQGIREVVMGMAHRGRLNVLANIVGKSPRQIFREFDDADPELYTGRGDVKYHLGHRGRWETATGQKVNIYMCFNPSHLEFVNPVALGRMRAKLDRLGDHQHEQGLVILIHGDAAFAGQGAVQETLNVSQLPGYSVGGTLHVVVNNQIGFTTSPKEGRSSLYATDVAKMLQIPIFHVNGEDPESVAQVVRLSMDFRMEFKRDVVIDMYGYRRLGHNEGDEPSFTQPLLYRTIEARKPVREGYLEHLLRMNGVSRREADEIADRRRANLEKELSEARSQSYRPPLKEVEGIWRGYLGASDLDVPEVPTGIAEEKLKVLLERQTQLPADFHPHPKINRFLENRRAMSAGQHPLDWSAAEALAFASLAAEKWYIRLSGQDSERGTFSQRHAVLHDYEDGHTYTPLQHIGPKQAPVEIRNSPLSEIVTLGFEYGYSLDWPDGLIAWEAQFGDFGNVAQVIIDQFIASAEDKWRRLSGLVLLLPHGFEGQGPEHSSARLERFLSLAAEDNIQVVYPSTPAQYFHVLRRQVVRRWRKPLVVMTPKSLLRHPQAVSTLAELAQRGFQRVLADPQTPSGNASQIILCTGKIFYELNKYRQDLSRSDVALIRLEQLYPLNREVLESVLGVYPDGTPVLWVQEEPENMGAWRFLRVSLGEKIYDRWPLSGLCRPASASPATGSHNSHKIEQERLLEAAFGKDSQPAVPPVPEQR
jgi:2-oxoglutarate dehydrogenase E1 component